MKQITLGIFIAIIVILFINVMPTKSDADIAKELCLEKGGIPIMNWNNSALKYCK